jgi:hypothetical protein
MRSVASVDPKQLDPVVSFPFKLSSSHKVVTAGSCFAQHIARHLKASGFNFLVTESAHPLLDRATAEQYGYGIFSARYGNIYSSRQLLQLVQRVYGSFSPEDGVWLGDGRFYDPFRPSIQPNGFPNRIELERDRAQHFAAVRLAIESMDVFVFTLGLTETWIDSVDGAAYPICPGVAAGTFEPARHRLLNLSVAEVVDDMRRAIGLIRERNPNVKVILTVSPVPLMATAEDRHVLVSTVYSKSVLRVAADVVARELDDVAYFPSFEIITGAFNRGAYFAEDLRSVREEGVEHVMRLFFQHATEAAAGDVGPGPSVEQPEMDFDRRLSDLVNVLCDEELLA